MEPRQVETTITPVVSSIDDEEIDLFVYDCVMNYLRSLGVTASIYSVEGPPERGLSLLHWSLIEIHRFHFPGYSSEYHVSAKLVIRTRRIEITGVVPY